MAPVTPINQKPGSPVWWVAKLTEKHSHRLRRIRKYLDYYEGDHNLAFASQKFKEHYGGLFRDLSDNICGVIVQAMAERMKVQGITTPTNDPSEQMTAYDPEAWAMWQRNAMDAHSQEHHTQTATTGFGYVTVWGDSDSKAVMTVEDSLQMIVASSSDTPRRREAALKRWTDEWTGLEFATLYLPNEIHKFTSKNPVNEFAGDLAQVQWVPRGDEPVLTNPLGVVPVVEFVNDPTVRGEGRSEIKSIIPIQDAINKLVCDMVLASEFAAYPQRWAVGLEQKVDKDGREMKPFVAALDRVWATPNNDAKFGQFAPADLTNYVKAKESLIQDAAFQSRTPRHYFTQSGQSPSGDALKSSETGLVAKVRDREVPLGESYEETFRLGYLVEGNEAKARAWDAEIKWKDPEYRTEGELTDAVIKQHGAGLIPWEYAVDRLGYSPQDIEKMRGMRMQEAVISAASDISNLLEE
jgi:hypothetical protein